MNLPATLRGVDRTYRAHFGHNAWSALEDQNVFYLDVATALRRRRPGDADRAIACAFLRAGLIDPPGDLVTPDELHAILDDIGGIPVLRRALPRRPQNRRGHP